MANPVETPPVVAQLRTAQAEPAGLADLLQYEGDVRRQASVDELVYFTANESRRIVPYDQMFILRQARVRDGFAVIGASSIALIDRNAPLIQAIEDVARDFGDAARSVDAAELSDDAAIAEYPFHAWHWQPLADRSGEVFAGLLLARETPLSDPERLRIARLGETVGHGWLALTGGKPARKIARLDRKSRNWLIGALVIGALFPVRMTALAPVEVVAAKPFMVSAPQAGVIARVEVAPNALVKAGQPVLTFEDIKLRNELEQAEEKLKVAQAKVEQATSAAFGDADQAREIGPLKAELELAQSDYAYARDLMGKSQIAAPRSGMAIYSDRRDWEGRAVNTGDPILQIADPTDIAYRIDLPTKEQMRLEQGEPVKIWLDAQPFSSLDGVIENASYQSRLTADGVLAFAVTAKPATRSLPRIGSRGTAKLYGQWAPFLYTVLRRPIASVRQYLGL